MKRACCLAAFLFLLLLRPVAAEDLQLEQVVLVSRHGVRSPTDIRPPLAQLAADPWPKWPVGPGELTPHGAKLATIMGGYYRDAFAREGLLAAEGCPRPHDLYVWSDVEERTRASAQAMMDGMYPGCELKPHMQADLKADDPLFHPTTAGVCKVDGAKQRNAIMERIADEDALPEEYSKWLPLLQSVLKCCAPAVCSKTGGPCTLDELPAGISAEGKIQGALPIASSLTEIFLLEYANGFPMNQVGWGRIDRLTLLRLGLLHTKYFDLSQFTRYPARRLGSNLLDQVLATMRAKVDRRADSNAKAPARSRAVLFVGHDSNIANLGGLLNATWMSDGYQANDTPPGGAIAFQLYRGQRSRKYFVRLRYYAQSPDQLRDLSTLDASDPLSPVEITVPGCAQDVEKVGACRWATFERLASAAVDRECVGSGTPAGKKPLKSK